jgi:hypothetical protein
VPRALLLAIRFRVPEALLTLEKQAPMWTLGVGGRPLVIGLGGVCLFLSLRLGGTGGVSESRSGPMLSSPLSEASFSPGTRAVVRIGPGARSRLVNANYYYYYYCYCRQVTFS